MNVKGLTVTVVGIVRSGVGASLLLKNKGAFVRATDSGRGEEVIRNAGTLKDNGIDVEVGGHTGSFVKGSDLIVVSPGVERGSLVIRCAEAAGIPVISELELGYRFCKGRIIAVTGTNGKTTTTALIGEIIKRSGTPVAVGGNIGTSLCSLAERITPEHIVVLEVSSFQMEWVDEFRPHVSVILNVTDDHMDRHGNFHEYAALKKKIFMNQTREDFLILNYEDPRLKDIGDTAPAKYFFSMKEKVKGIFARKEEIVLNTAQGPRSVCATSLVRLKGLHNLENVMASILACTLMGVDHSRIVESISSFEGLPHRFQHIGEIGGVSFIDDSKATNVDATLRALESLDKPAVLIAGGRDKAGNFAPVRDIAKEKIRAFVLIGEAKEKIKSSMGGAAVVREADSLEAAVELAYGMARRGDAVLLSPMCASFDMFKDYSERGECFTRAVRALRGRE